MEKDLEEPEVQEKELMREKNVIMKQDGWEKVKV